MLLVQGPDIQQMGFRSAHFSRVHQACRVWLEHNLVLRLAPENGLFYSAASGSRLKNRFGKGMVFQPCRPSARNSGFSHRGLARVHTIRYFWDRCQ